MKSRCQFQSVKLYRKLSFERLRSWYGQSVVDLESASGSGWVLAGAVAVTLDLDIGQLGDGDDRDGGVKSDAESVLRKLVHDVLYIKENLLWGHADLWGLEANFTVSSHV